MRDRWIASLDVQNCSVNDIADAVGCSVETVRGTKRKAGYDELCQELISAATADLVPMIRNTLMKFLIGAALGADKLIEQLELEEDGLAQHGIQQKAAIALNSNPALIKMLAPFVGGPEEGGKHSGGGATININVQKDGTIAVGEVIHKEVIDGDWTALESGEDGAAPDPEVEYTPPPEPGEDVGF